MLLPSNKGRVYKSLVYILLIPHILAFEEASSYCDLALAIQAACFVFLWLKSKNSDGEMQPDLYLSKYPSQLAQHFYNKLNVK
jgi:hypothetical protein